MPRLAERRKNRGHELSGADSGVAMLLVEQHVRLALELTAGAMVIERGRVVHRAASPALLEDAATLARLVAIDEAGPA